jgi:monofunctional biosynthetic peptidoglycan transglycosylase
MKSLQKSRKFSNKAASKRPILRIAYRLAIACGCLSVFAFLVTRIINPPLTPLMLIRAGEGWWNGKGVGMNREWKELEQLSPNIVRAVISSEDGGYFDHSGVDWRAIRAAREWNSKSYHRTKRGGSTITMQAVKNVFLWPGRTYIRKAAEIYLAYLGDFLWGKRRTLEIYLNVIEWGDGIYGVEAASRHYFKKSSSKLSVGEAALLAAILPNPREWSPISPSRYIQKRSSSIVARMRAVNLKELR